MNKNIVVLAIFLSLSSIHLAYAQSVNTLWYKNPANYFEENLVLGNGKMGASVLGNEHIYFNRPPISADTTMDVKNMPVNQIDTMNKISKLIADVDSNFDDLQLLYTNNKQLQFSNLINAR